MPQIIDTKKEFSLMARGRSFVNAMRGLGVFLKTTPNAWIQIIILMIAFYLGLYYGINQLEWFMIIIAGGLVLTAEAFNTAIEIDINLTSPDQHPYARDTKDVAAGAVLITSITAAIIGLMVFVPYIMSSLRSCF
jgi:diacylglycerol kinase (ATP)